MAYNLERVFKLMAEARVREDKIMSLKIDDPATLTQLVMEDIANRNLLFSDALDELKFSSALPSFTNLNDEPQQPINSIPDANSGRG